MAVGATSAGLRVDRAGDRAPPEIQKAAHRRAGPQVVGYPAVKPETPGLWSYRGGTNLRASSSPTFLTSFLGRYRTVCAGFRIPRFLQRSSILRLRKRANHNSTVDLIGCGDPWPADHLAPYEKDHAKIHPDDRLRRILGMLMIPHCARSDSSSRLRLCKRPGSNA
jgi:hypothetical protein